MSVSYGPAVVGAPIYPGGEPGSSSSALPAGVTCPSGYTWGAVASTPNWYGCVNPSGQTGSEVTIAANELTGRMAFAAAALGILLLLPGGWKILAAIPAIGVADPNAFHLSL